MNIRIDINELSAVLERTPARHNIMLTGRHGIGKSEILTKHFEIKGMRVVALFLGQMSDPGDLIGLPDRSGEKTIFRPPYWFPLDGEPIVLFLDELNRARPEVLQTVMDLVLNRKIAGRTLPEGSRVIAAVNEGEEYQLTDLDPALVSRFNIYRFEPTPSEWLLWARANKLDERVIDFISENQAWLDGVPQSENFDTGLDKTPDRRAWKRVSDIITGTESISKADIKTLAGIVGIKAANYFVAQMNLTKEVSGRDVLFDFAGAQKSLAKLKTHDFALINEEMFQHLEVYAIGQADRKKVAKNIQKYVDFLKKNNKGEVLASFCSQIVTSGGKQRYPKACEFIVGNCPDVMMEMMNYVSNLK